MNPEFGPFATIVALAGSIMAAAGAIGIAWFGRAKWAPVQEELPGGAKKVSALLAGVVIVILFVSWRTPERASDLTVLLVIAAGLTLVLFVAYQHLLGLRTFRVLKGTKHETRVIGGSELTQQAKDAAHERKIEDPEDLLPGFANDPVQVWTRSSRERAKTLLSLLYALFLLTGSVALAAAAIRLSIAIGSV